MNDEHEPFQIEAELSRKITRDLRKAAEHMLEAVLVPSVEDLPDELKMTLFIVWRNAEIMARKAESEIAEFGRIWVE